MSQDQRKAEPWRTRFGSLILGTGLSCRVLDARVLHLRFSEDCEPPSLSEALRLQSWHRVQVCYRPSAEAFQLQSVFQDELQQGEGEETRPSSLTRKGRLRLCLCCWAIRVQGQC